MSTHALCTMEHQQLPTMLIMEKFYYSVKIIHQQQSNPKRRLIADGVNKLSEDEHVSDDVFPLTMNIFDRYTAQYSSSIIVDDRHWQLLALSCYNLAKKLRTNTAIGNENEQTSLILLNENYSDQEIFNGEQTIAESLDWDLAAVVTHDYVPLLIEHILPINQETMEFRAKIRLHVNILLSLATCELHSFTILPSLLACACLKAAIKGLFPVHIHHIDEKLARAIDCTKIDLLHSQRQIEQLLQSCLQEMTPSPRRCLAPIDSTSPQQRTRVK